MWVKICGIRDAVTARAVSELGADAIGLNFYAPSPRSVTVSQAAEIVAALPETVEPVGVFVNHSVDEIQAACRQCRINTIQLHGDESAEFLANLQNEMPQAALIRAYRLGSEGLGALADFLDACQRLNTRLQACLIDARVEGIYGGSGITVAWDVLRAEYRYDTWPALILAGGLHAENVAQAIHAAQPWGVDTASGVESSPGNKDLDRVAAFLRAARQGGPKSLPS